MSQNVRIDHVTKIYDNRVRAVDDVSLDIRAGEFFTLLGPSGCGKTTLLRMIAGFNTIEEGQIFFGDQPINNVPAHLRNVGMVFQNYAIFPHMSVRDNIAYGLKARKIRGEELIRRISDAMELMAISQYGDRQPSQLSGGQQQRVALARAIVIHPAVLLMDEPLSNLDAKLRVQMRTSIKKLQLNLGITTIYVTHDQEEALAISDRIAIMNNGKLEQVGSPEEVYTKPANAFVANFIGTSSFINGFAKNGAVELPGTGKIPANIRPDFEGAVTVALRPEHASLQEEKSGELCGTISMATFLGSYVNYEVQLDEGPLLEIHDMQSVSRRWTMGQRVSVIPGTAQLIAFDQKSGCSVMNSTL